MRRIWENEAEGGQECEDAYQTQHWSIYFRSMKDCRVQKEALFCELSPKTDHPILHT
jgi:hypothetical protein